MVKTIRTIEEINAKIAKGDALVITASEMKQLVEEKGIKVAAKEIDVVTTGTLGAMCSSGAIINLGHADPPIKIQRAWLNNVETTHPGAAVDLYIGATIMDETRPFLYGGGHVIEDLIRGKTVDFRATAYGTDCYPRTSLDSVLTKDNLNQFILLNFRNCYQRYNCATNGRDEIIHTYMGKLLPHYGNASFSGAGELNPLSNDPDYETIGIGTRIFLGGAQGYVIGEGTQHDPRHGFGNIMVRGNCKEMSPEFIRGASFTNYGTTLYVGVGIPIPILNERLAAKTAIKDEEIHVNIIDYGVPRRSRPSLGTVSYKELKSGTITIGKRDVKVSPLSSLKGAQRIAETLKAWITSSEFSLTLPIDPLPKDTPFTPMHQIKLIPFVEDVARPATTCREDETIEVIAKRIIDHSINHIVIIDEIGHLKGIVTSWDVTRAVATGKKDLSEIITKRVITATPNEPIDSASRKLAQHNISALPVVDSKGVVRGIITSEDLSQLIRR